MQPQFIQLLWKPVEQNLNFVFVALILIVLDVVFGFTNALLKCEVSSSKMREGLQHKLGSIFLILAADIVDGALLGGVDLGVNAPVLTAVCLYISLMELISCLENISKLNPELTDNPLLGGVTKRLASVETAPAAEIVETEQAEPIETEQEGIEYEVGEL